MNHRNTIIHANCLEFLPQLPGRSVDFILTDPPYITRYKPRDGRTVLNDDNDAWLKPAFADARWRAIRISAIVTAVLSGTFWRDQVKRRREAERDSWEPPPMPR